MFEVKQMNLGGSDHANLWFVSVATKSTAKYDSTRGVVLELPERYSPLHDDPYSENPFPCMRQAFVEAYAKVDISFFKYGFSNFEDIRVVSFTCL